MCTMISQQVAVSGSGKAPAGWFAVRQASVSYDHPFDVGLEYALNLDFGNAAVGPGARVAVELDAGTRPAPWWRRSRPCWRAPKRAATWRSNDRLKGEQRAGIPFDFAQDMLRLVVIR